MKNKNKQLKDNLLIPVELLEYILLYLDDDTLMKLYYDNLFLRPFITNKTFQIQKISNVWEHKDMKNNYISFFYAEKEFVYNKYKPFNKQQSLNTTKYFINWYYKSYIRNNVEGLIYKIATRMYSDSDSQKEMYYDTRFLYVDDYIWISHLVHEHYYYMIDEKYDPKLLNQIEKDIYSYLQHDYLGGSVKGRHKDIDAYYTESELLEYLYDNFTIEYKNIYGSYNVVKGGVRTEAGDTGYIKTFDTIQRDNLFDVDCRAPNTKEEAEFMNEVKRKLETYVPDKIDIPYGGLIKELYNKSVYSLKYCKDIEYIMNLK